MDSWMPPSASSVSDQVDFVFGLLFWICAFFYLLIVGLTATFTIRYRSRKWNDVEPTASHNTKLEILWSAIPLLLLVGIFSISTATWLDMFEPVLASEPTEVHVTARKWKWHFDHPGGRGSMELHLVKDEPVRLVIGSEDVVHSLYVPAFRLKMDAVPGRYTKMIVTPTVEGSFVIYCAEYCGTDHSTMSTRVFVHATRAEYEDWVANPVDESVPLDELGAKVYVEQGCKTCHSLDGTRGKGPSFKGLWGTSETLADGSSVRVDENYIRESIVEPKAKIVAGFEPVMSPVPLGEREILGVIAYIKSLE